MPSPEQQQRARIFGVLFGLTFVTSIAALLLYDPVLNDADYAWAISDPTVADVLRVKATPPGHARGSLGATATAPQAVIPSSHSRRGTDAGEDRCRRRRWSRRGVSSTRGAALL